MNQDKELQNLREFAQEVKKLIREQGKSGVFSVDKIESLFVKYGIKLK